MLDVFVRKMEDYNKLVKRFNDAVKFLDSKDIENDRKEQHLSKFVQIVKGTQSILSYFDKQGFDYTTDEVLGGFNIELRRERYNNYAY